VLFKEWRQRRAKKWIEKYMERNKDLVEKASYGSGLDREARIERRVRQMEEDAESEAINEEARRRFRERHGEG